MRIWTGQIAVLKGEHARNHAVFEVDSPLDSPFEGLGQAVIMAFGHNDNKCNRSNMTCAAPVNVFVGWKCCCFLHKSAGRKMTQVCLEMAENSNRHQVVSGANG